MVTNSRALGLALNKRTGARGSTCSPTWTALRVALEGLSGFHRRAQAINVTSRRGSQDKKPWKDLNLAAIEERNIETAHLFELHLGETIAPYVHLEPMRALLPIKQGDHEMPIDPDGVGGISLGQLGRLMRQRWQTISSLWEANKAEAARLSLIDRFDYMGELSSQLEWQSNPADSRIRVVYTKSGEPTAAIIRDDRALIDHLLYWIPCRDGDEANYLLAIINSDALQEAVQPFMSKGQFGARDLHKHLWKLPIPEYDPGRQLHVEITQAGASAATGAADQLAALLKGRGGRLTSTITRRELRKWLRASDEGKAIETAATRLLAGDQ